MRTLCLTNGLNRLRILVSFTRKVTGLQSSRNLSNYIGVISNWKWSQKRLLFIYEAKNKPDETELIVVAVDIFKISRNNYGTCKIKKELVKKDMVVSCHRIMMQEGLVSSYTVTQFCLQKNTRNQSKTGNVAGRHFKGQPYRNIAVSNLTYVKVGVNWNYICVLIVLFNLEIIGYSAGQNKPADLIRQVFQIVSIWRFEGYLHFPYRPRQ